MNPLAEVILRSGILKEEELAEFRRWKTPGVDGAPSDGPPINSPEELVAGIEQALQSKDLVLVRSTDLDIVPQFLSTQERGELYVELSNEEGEQVKGDFEIVFGRTKLGEYILQWNGDALEGVLEEGNCFLIDHGQKIWFRDMRVLFFGDQKVFMICVPGES